MESSRDPAVAAHEAEDFVWRFALPAEEAPPDDPLVEMIRAFLADFASFGFLTANGERIRCDGFAFLNDPLTIHSIFRDGVSEGRDARQSP